MTKKVAFRIGLGLAAVCVLAVGVGGIFWWRAQRRAAAVAERQALFASFGIDSDGTEDFVPLPRIMPHKLPAAVLGRTLFLDRRLAQGQSIKRTCAACHWPNAGGTDGKCHAGTLTRPFPNAAFGSVFLQDGSLTNLSDVVVRMVESPDFCGGGPVSNVVAKLNEDKRLVERFQFAYDGEGLTAATLADAVVNYARSQVSEPTAFDAFTGGRDDAFDAQQKKGMTLFQRNCLACHDGPTLGGRRASEGRKVPALRGLSMRKVYLSDGSQMDLTAVLSRMPVGEQEAADRAALVAFLKTL